MASSLPTRSATRLCRGCAEAQRLVNRLSQQLENETPPTPAQIVQSLPLLLESVLADLLAEHDPALHPHSRITRAIHLLARGAEQAQVLFEASAAVPAAPA
jgi:hypothetical protein